MIFFHVVSVYQLLNAVLLRKKYREERACLFIRDILLPKLKAESFLYEEFDKVVVYGDIWSGKTIDEQEQVITNYYNDLFSKNDVSLKEGDEIIVGCAHNTFGMYLSINGIHFSFLEDAAGLISRYWILDDINKKQLALKYELICKWGLINAQNHLITKIICDFRAQDENFQPSKDKYLDFCVAKELAMLSEAERTRVISIFTDTKEIAIRPNSLLLLTQHFANLRTLSFEEQIYIYQIFMDYYTGNYNVVIKPHPDDLMFYPLLFPDVEIVKDRFPAEFLPFITTNVPKVVATVSSTSIFSLRSCFPTTLEMGTEFEKDYKYTHKYFCALKLIEALGGNMLVDYLGCNMRMVDVLISQNELKISREESKCTASFKIKCVDKIGEENGEITIKEDLSKEIIFFLNSDNCYDFSNWIEKDWGNLIPIVIRKKPIAKKNDGVPLMDLGEEVIYIHTTNSDYKNKIREFEMKKELESSNIVLEISQMSEEEEKIKILEGMLAATEAKLKYYMHLTEEKGV